MDYLTTISEESFEGDLEETLSYLINKDVMMAVHNDETGLSFSMMRLGPGQTMELDGSAGETVVVKRQVVSEDEMILPTWNGTEMRGDH